MKKCLSLCLMVVMFFSLTACHTVPDISEDGGVLCANLMCEIDHHTARGLREKIDTAMRRTLLRSFSVSSRVVKFSYQTEVLYSSENW